MAALSSQQKAIMRRFVSLFFCLFLPLCVFAQKRITKEEYIDRYKEIAVREMKRNGIPASITLGQGMLESDNGNSTLARKANNHFGIKCHDWKGKKVYHDDDEKGECFRKYSSAEESFEDHSDFLTSTRRYASLFQLDTKDYKAWARGLKKAGYATNDKYAEILIKIIEDNELYKLDEEGGIRAISNKKHKWEEGGDSLRFRVKRPVFTRNRVEYVLVRKGDNFNKIADELGMMYWELPSYNDMPKDTTLTEGMELYIQPKRWRAERGFDHHIVKEGETMHEISQKYGIKLKRLYRRNRMKLGTQPVVGEKIWLRKRRPASE
jgi:hypothetical protein